jgi:exopolyphosphatase/guanosine-5'-triphosphate,3'-diphosphate pyrophosphatase
VTRVAAVDCGTNTVRLLVADLDPVSGAEAELVREARVVRLGEGVDAAGRLSAEALARALAVVEEYAATARGLGAEAVRFCATSAVRDAANAPAFLGAVHVRLGVVPETLSGTEEARLSYDGATRSLPGLPEPVLVVDVGGGSTETVLGRGDGTVLAAHSLDLGAVRLTERCLAGDPPSASEVAGAEAEVDRALDRLPAHGVDLAVAASVVAVSGTALTVAAAVLGLPRLERSALHGAVVEVDAVHRVAERLLAMPVARRSGLAYMHPGRADVIGAGALVLDRVLRRTRVPQLRISVADLLDGIAWSRA